MNDLKNRDRLIRTVADRGIVKASGNHVESLDAADYAAIEKATAPSAVVLIYQRDDGGWTAEHSRYGKVSGGDSEILIRALRSWEVVDA